MAECLCIMLPTYYYYSCYKLISVRFAAMAVACVTECQEVSAYRCVMGITAIALQLREAKQIHEDGA